MKRLIVNADDFGMAESVNIGIIRGHREGIVTSTSLLAGGAAAGHAATLAKENPALSVGIHLCLSAERPVTAPERIPSLARNGMLPSGPFDFMLRYTAGRISKNDIETELRAQIEKALSLGVTPSHFDGHQHLYMMPGVFPIAVKLAEEYGIKGVRYPVGPNVGIKSIARAGEKLFLEGFAVRQKRLIDESGLKRPDNFFGLPQTGRMDSAALTEIIENLPKGTSEIMCHPGLPNEVLARKINWGYGWEHELAAVTDKAVKARVNTEGIELSPYPPAQTG